MEKRIFIFIMVLFLLSIYTIGFSYNGVEKNYIDFPEIDYSKGEMFIYGSIIKLDYENKEIIVDQHIDDNSIEISPILQVREDVVLILQRNHKKMNVDFEDLKIGDGLGIILDEYGLARGIIIIV